MIRLSKSENLLLPFYELINFVLPVKTEIQKAFYRNWTPVSAGMTRSKLIWTGFKFSRIKSPSSSPPTFPMNFVGNPIWAKATIVLATEPPPLLDFMVPSRFNCSKRDWKASSEPKPSFPGSRRNSFEEIDLKSSTPKIKSRLRAPNPTMSFKFS